MKITTERIVDFGIIPLTAFMLGIFVGLIPSYFTHPEPAKCTHIVYSQESNEDLLTSPWEIDEYEPDNA